MFRACLSLSLTLACSLAFGETPLEREAGNFPEFQILTLLSMGVLFAGTVACWLVWYRFFRVPPTESADVGTRIELFQMPNTQLKRIRGDGLVVVCGGDAWIGKNVGKIVRDVGGDRIQDELRAAGALGELEARIVGGVKLKMRHVIAVNGYDSGNRTSLAHMDAALHAAIVAAMANSCDSIVFADFSDDFDYSRDRSDCGFAATAIFQAILRHNTEFSVARIFIPNKANYRAYSDLLAHVRSGRPAQPPAPTPARQS